MTQGSNVKKLIVWKMAQLAIPTGGKSGLELGVDFLLNPAAINAAAKQATTWVEEFINIQKSFPGNPFPDDEAIAGAMLAQIESSKRKQH